METGEIFQPTDMFHSTFLSIPLQTMKNVTEMCFPTGRGTSWYRILPAMFEATNLGGFDETSRHFLVFLWQKH